MNIPIDHHYVPEFYFKPWCSEDKKMYAYKRVHGDKISCDSVSPKGTAYQPHLNTIIGVPPERQGDFETKFMARQIDDPAALVFSKLVNGDGKLSDDEFYAMTTFLHSLIFRHPTNLERIKTDSPGRMKQELEKDKEQDKEFYKLLSADDQKLSSYELYEKYISSNFRENIGLHLAEVAIKNPERREQYYNMDWVVKDVSQSDQTLFTSDRPLIFSGMNDPGNKFIALPISPTKILFGFGKNSPLPNLLKTASHTSIIQGINDRVIRQAHERCYHLNKDQKDFVHPRLSRENSK